MTEGIFLNNDSNDFSNWMHRGKNNRGKVITMCGRFYIDSDMADEIE